MLAFLLVCVMLFSCLAPPLSYASDFGDEITESAEAAEVVEVDDAAEEVEGDFTEEAEETTEAEKEDVAGTETEDTTITTQSMGSEVGISSDKGIELTYSADGVTVFNRDALKDGEVWADKSVEKTSATDSSFNETLSIYGKRFTYQSTYETGNYVLVVDTTRSLYLADTSGSFIQSITAATNAMVADICKNPLSNVSLLRPLRPQQIHPAQQKYLRHHRTSGYGQLVKGGKSADLFCLCLKRAGLVHRCHHCGDQLQNRLYRQTLYQLWHVYPSRHRTCCQHFGSANG